MKKKWMTAVAIALALFAPAVAGAAERPYKFTGVQLYLAAHGTEIASKKDDGIVFNQVGKGLALHALIRGPERGGQVRRIAVKITGISCSSDCHTQRFSMRPGRLNRGGYAFPKHKVDSWGCGSPKIEARLILRSGRMAARSTWKPHTACGEAATSRPRPADRQSCGKVL